MNPVFQLRAAVAADLGLLTGFVRDFYPGEHIAFDEGAARAALLGLLAEPAFGRIWLIEQAGEAIGYVVLTIGYSIEFGGHDAFIDELYVRPDRRGHGAGTAALRFVESVCPALSVRALHLEVERENVRAQALYRRHGFADHDRYLLTKQITP